MIALPPPSSFFKHHRPTRRGWILTTGLLGVALSASAALLGCRQELTSADEGPEATQLTLDVGDNVVVGLGTSVQLSATPRDSQGQPVSGYEITWSSADATVVSMDGDGYLTAVALGTTTITAIAAKPDRGKGAGGKENAPGQLKKAIHVTVDSTQVASVEVDPDPAQLVVGDEQRMTPILRDADGNVLSDRIVRWAILNESIAQVDELGNVLGNSAGTTTVTATSEEVTGSAAVVVEEFAAPVVDVAVWPTDITIDPNKQAQFYAAMLHSDGSVSCAPESPSTDPSVLFNATVVAGCDSAAARLDYSKAGGAADVAPLQVAAIFRRR